MKTILLFICIIISLASSATNYYVKIGGSDAANGLSDATAWGTVTKVRNTIFAAGDSVLFKRGNTWVISNSESLSIDCSGAAGSPIVISGYGTGAKPVFTSFSTISGWTNEGGGIFSKIIAVESNADVFTYNVTIDNVLTPMGRYPQTGWLVYEGVGSLETSITDNQLADSPSWVGAEAIIKKHVTGWMVDRNTIVSQSAGKITYDRGSNWQPVVGFGYFFQSDLKTLTYFGAWHYNRTTSKFSMYFGAVDPTTKVVKFSTQKNASVPYNRHYQTFDGLTFSGFNNYGIFNRGGHDIHIQNCTFEFVGLAACGVSPFDGGASYLVFENNTITNCGTGIEIKGTGDHMTVRNNTISSIGLIPGQCAIYTGDNAGDAIALEHNNSLVEYNVITNVGHSGIRIGGENMIVRYNYINGFANTRNDAGGIYFWNPHGSDYHGCKVQNNITINGNPVSSGVGSNTGVNLYEWGVYLDEHSNNISVTGNTAANCPTAGFTILMSTADTLDGNTSYNNGFQLDINSMWGTESLRNAKITNNLFIAKTAGQFVFRYHSRSHDMDSIGVFGGNYYARPIDDNKTFQSLYMYDAPVTYTLAEWQALSKQDASSHKSAVTVSDTSQFHFLYNAGKSNQTYALSESMVDVAAASYSGSITLLPFTSRVLIGNAIITSPPVTSSTKIVMNKGKTVMYKGKIVK